MEVILYAYDMRVCVQLAKERNQLVKKNINKQRI